MSPPSSLGGGHVRPYAVGHARAVITAPLSVPYLGHVPRQVPFEGVRDDLYAHAVAVTGHGGAALVISADLIGLGRGLVGAPGGIAGVVRSRVSERTGIDRDAILLCATHAHSTPETTGITRLPATDDVVRWIDDLVDNLVSVAVRAVESAVPAELFSGSVVVDGVATIRRHRPCGGGDVVMAPADDTVPTAMPDLSLTVLAARDADGRQTLLTNFACHPVALSVQPMMSADYPGELVRLLGDRGVQALFLQGACGDVNPVRRHEAEADVRRCGAILADASQAAACRAYDSEPLTGPIRARSVRVPVPKRPAPDADTVAAATAASTSSDPAARVGARTVLDLVDRLADPTVPLTTEVQAIRIGDVAIVGLPGEAFTELGLLVKAMSPAARTLVVGYANDYVGYLAPRSEWLDGGYETQEGPWSLVSGQGTEDIANAAARLVDALWQ